MALKYRTNRYNWLAQKLLAQHEFSSIIWLKQNMQVNGSAKDEQDSTKRPVSDHVNFVYSLALLRTGSRMDAIIDTLQQLNFYQNSQYFILLCQYLAYLGRHDSVVALCRQVIGQQLNYQRITDSTHESVRNILVDEGQLHLINDAEKQEELSKSLGPLMQQESFDTRKVFENISASSLIDNPRLWFIFGTSLEYQHQLKDAQTTFRVASMLTSRQIGGHNSAEIPDSFRFNSYFLPSIKYAEICARYRSNLKQAVQALFPSEHISAQNITSTHILVFYLYKQQASSKANLHRAVELVTNLESYLTSTKNPAQVYNHISLCCRQKLEHQSNELDWQTPLANLREDETHLNFILAKTFVYINSIAVISSELNLHETEQGKLKTKRLDQCIESLQASNSVCWNTPSLWNNLGICYMSKRRNIASISCLTKAHSLNPIDWRINFNLAMACIQVGLFCKASIHLMATKNLYNKQALFQSNNIYIEPLITILQAICYEKLDQPLEARRFYIEATQLPFKNIADAPVLAIVNYLIFLQNHIDIKNIQDDISYKVKLQLLEKLEQHWLQRDKSSHQFQDNLLRVASEIAKQINPEGKEYAWMKLDKGSAEVVS